MVKAKNKLGRRRTLAQQVTLAAVAAAAIAGLSPIAAQRMVEQHNDAAVASTVLSNKLRGFVSLATKPFMEGDIEEVTRIATIFHADKSIDTVILLDENSQPLISLGEASFVLAMPEVRLMVRERAGAEQFGDHLVQVRPIAIEGRIYGTILMRAGTFTNFENHHYHYGIQLFIVLVALAGIYPFVLMFTHRAFRPIDYVAIALKDLKPGQNEKVVQAAGNISEHLAASLEEMTNRYDAVIRKSRKLAVSDPLTGLFNRAYFAKQVDTYLSAAGERSVSVVFADIDRFRAVNDILGPRGADDLLAGLAKRIKEAAHEADQVLRPKFAGQAPSVVGRLGADQFAFVVPFVDDSTVADFILRIEKVISKPIEKDGRHIDISATFAAASAPGNTIGAADLMKRADLTLQASKTEGGKSLQFFSEDIQKKANDQVRLEEEIRRGVFRGEFVAVFQPKVHLETGKIVGAEALARWRRPDGAVVSPGVFVQKAEEMGMIAELGMAIMRDAVAQAAKWNRNGARLKVAVNVSPIQFQDPGFIPAVYDVLDENGLPPELLELEVTESTAVENPEKVARVMRPLRAKGVRLAIDDFGTGHSNFKTVTHLPFDVFKVDQQFVKSLGVDPHASAIVEMILAMAEALNQETVAEGIETAEHFDFLRRRGCKIGQGYYFSPPLPSHEFEALVKTWRIPAPLRTPAE